MTTERPILFSAPMIRALLAGTKTQTRRVVKPQPDEDGLARLAGQWIWHDTSERTFRCPYGQPGERLWVRENFSGSIAYERHGYPLKEWGNKIWYWADGNPQRGDWTKPRPSIHMPRHLSRITLELTEVRVERLQDISEADALAEGVANSLHLPGGRFANENYAHLWDAINGPGSWDANPFVWCVAFKMAAP